MHRMYGPLAFVYYEWEYFEGVRVWMATHGDADDATRVQTKWPTVVWNGIYMCGYGDKR